MKFFSRTRDEITDSFPELPYALAGLSQDAILDGEIVAWEYPQNISETQQIVDDKPSEVSEQKAMQLGQARPFSVLQQRLGRKKVSDKMLRETPVAFLVFDVLYASRRVGDGSSTAGAGTDPGSVAARRIDLRHNWNARKQPGKTGTQAQASLRRSRTQSAAQIIRAPVFRALIPRGTGGAVCRRRRSGATKA